MFFLSSFFYWCWIRDLWTEIRDLRSRIRDPRSEIRDPRSEIRDPRSENRDPRSRIQDPESKIQDQRSGFPRSGIRGRQLTVSVPCVISQAGDSGRKNMTTRNIIGKTTVIPASVRQCSHYNSKFIFKKPLPCIWKLWYRLLNELNFQHSIARPHPELFFPFNKLHSRDTVHLNLVV